MLSKLFSPAAIELNLKAQNQEAAFRELVALVPNLNEGARAGLLLSLLGRERLGSTALGRAIALPHVRYSVPGVSKPQIIFGRSPDGINYGAPDGKPVRLFFLLVSPDVSQHLHILSRLSRLLRNPALIEQLTSAATTGEVMRALETTERNTAKPAVVGAAA
jgi:mannitol/fructose-specific phosphotransferase system IIA component (Ntr-type)